MLWTLAPNSTKPAQRVSTQRGYWAVVGWNWKLLLPLVDYAGTLAKLRCTVYLCPYAPCFSTHSEVLPQFWNICMFAPLCLTVPAHSDQRLCFPLHVHAPELHDEPADSSAQHFPANNFLPFVQGDEENGLISASGRSNFISVSKWAFSCVSFCTISKSFCRRFIFLLLFMKMDIFIFSFLAHNLVHSVPSISLWHNRQLSRSDDIFLLVFWRSADISWLLLTKTTHSILMDFNSGGVYMSIISTVDTHGWIPPHWGASKYRHLSKLNIR